MCTCSAFVLVLWDGTDFRLGESISSRSWIMGKSPFQIPQDRTCTPLQTALKTQTKSRPQYAQWNASIPTWYILPLPLLLRSLHFQTSLPFPFPFFKGVSDNHSPSTHTRTPSQCLITLGVSSGRSTTSFWTWFSGRMWCFCWSIREKLDGILHSYVWPWRNWSLMPRWGLNRLL
jgi:hypothetical protein